MAGEITISISGPRLPVEIRFDRVAQAVYIRIRFGPVARTIEHSAGVYLDVDPEGRLLGIEAYVPVQFSGIKDAAAEYLKTDEDRKAIDEASRFVEAMPV